MNNIFIIILRNLCMNLLGNQNIPIYITVTNISATLFLLPADFIAAAKYQNIQKKSKNS